MGSPYILCALPAQHNHFNAMLYLRMGLQDKRCKCDARAAIAMHGVVGMDEAHRMIAWWAHLFPQTLRIYGDVVQMAGDLVTNPWSARVLLHCIKKLAQWGPLLQ
jgi:hypothetical protein